MRIYKNSAPDIKDLQSFKAHSRLTKAENNALLLLDEIFHFVLNRYMKGLPEKTRKLLREYLDNTLGAVNSNEVFSIFSDNFYRFTPQSAVPHDIDDLLLLWITNQNPVIPRITNLFNDLLLYEKTEYKAAIEASYRFLGRFKGFGPDTLNIIDFLLQPGLKAPGSLEGQLLYILENWGDYIGDFKARILRGLDFLKEEHKSSFPPGPGPSHALSYTGDFEGGGFSDDTPWMPNVVMIAKSTLVWLDQLSKKYKKAIRRLDEIPDEELRLLVDRGINTLWLIGLWERSNASKRIKNLCGNPEAESSAYSLKSYEIAAEIGGWDALNTLKSRCFTLGLRLASDMVPNHTGIDSDWMMDHPDRFVQVPDAPYPGYTFNGENLSSRSDTGIFLEDHYYDKTDAAVVFKYVHYPTNTVRYIYHGNDGTSMPWNDTAQLNYLDPNVREAVIQTILHVARSFPVIRFDAAMTLAKKHVQRLWYPAPGTGGDIPSRAEHGMTAEEFNRAMPREFWREVVDRIAAEVPDTLLLAEAFWMMEGYFVKTLGMHRVYNSAFMNMLKAEENGKFKESIKNTLLFDPEILKRFVNFMNNPDEETAVQQFGKGDKYFGICTMMITMPGLPMFGHGQIEGFREKYGMEYRRAYLNETPDESFVDRHKKDIFPLLKKRALFSESKYFLLYDLIAPDGSVNENVFIWSNKYKNQYSLSAYNNSPYDASGRIYQSSQKNISTSDEANTVVISFPRALDLQGQENEYVYFTEFHSGLTYIRSAGELYNNGLFIQLSPYGSHVFLDFITVFDNDGTWKTLTDRLNGSGTADIHRFKRKLFFEPAGNVLQRFFTAERTSSIKAPDRSFLDAFISDFEELCLILKSLGFIDGEIQQALLHILQNRMDRYIKILQQKTDVQTRYISEGMTIMTESPVLLTAWFILSPLQIIFQKNGFLTEMSELAEDMGVLSLLEQSISPLSLTSSETAEVRALFAFLSGFQNGSDTAPYPVLHDILEIEDVKTYCAVNTWKGTEYFKRESFQALTWWVHLMLLLNNGDSAAAEKICTSWIESEENSNSETDKLLEYCRV